MNATAEPATQINLDAFAAQLAKEYTKLFTRPAYAAAAARFTPFDMAHKMALGLDNGTADKNGEGIRRACEALGIQHTYKAIREFLKAR